MNEGDEGVDADRNLGPLFPVPICWYSKSRLRTMPESLGELGVDCVVFSGTSSQGELASVGGSLTVPSKSHSLAIVRSSSGFSMSPVPVVIV